MTENRESVDRGRTLVLLPTPKERDRAASFLTGDWQLQLCGFGLLAAGIETARLLGQAKFDRVILLGIAGTYDSQVLPVGTACSFGHVACYGIGAGEGENFQTARELGFNSRNHPETISLEPIENASQHKLLLSVTSATSTPEHVQLRRARFPQAVAEDMEAFSVALASSVFRVPLTVIRGISNVVGDRDHSGWQIDAALKAAVDVLESRSVD